MLWHLVVQCEPNDTVDIKCGGPHILGYDFYCEDNDVDELRDFITEKLKEYKQPLMGIVVLKAQGKYGCWTKEMIEREIKMGYK